jgi:hypothetical protein
LGEAPKKKVSVEQIEELSAQGKTYKEIAAMFDTTENYVKMKVYRARHPDYDERDRHSGWERNAKKQSEKRAKARIEKYGYAETMKELREREAATGEKVTFIDPDKALKPTASYLTRKVGKIGDDNVGKLVSYHAAFLKMRQGVDKRNVEDLYVRFALFLEYCAEHNILPTNSSAYFAIGITADDIKNWKAGRAGTPDHRRFAEDVSAMFASIHEQAPTEGLLNPVLSIYWSKAHDGYTDAPKQEVVIDDPLGEKRSSEEIQKKYADILPDD